MWTFIIIALLASCAAGIVYLSGRIRRFNFINVLSRGNKPGKMIISYGIIIILLVILHLLFGMINAVIMIIHLMVLWIVCDAAGKALRHFADKKRIPDNGADIPADELCHGKSGKYYEGIAAIIITCVYLTCGWYFANNVWRTSYTVTTDKKVGSLRIVQFADSHVGNTFSGKGFAEHIKAIQDEDPDVVLITGDFVDDETSLQNMKDACKALGTLKTTYGVYYSFGNHDKGYYPEEYRGYNGEDLIHELEDNNVTVLQDESVLIDDRYYIAGRKDRSEKYRQSNSENVTGRKTAAELVEGLDAGKYIIVLDHQPCEYDELQNAGVDLVLSGHTHGGQLFPFNRMGQWTGIDAKSYGLETRGGTTFVVTSGISDWAIKFRTGCKAEYVVLDVTEN